MLQCQTTALDLITADFLRAFNWTRVALLYESGADAGWADTAIQINTTLQSSGFSVFSTFFLSVEGACVQRVVHVNGCT
jgi:hypothetical protein